MDTFHPKKDNFIVRIPPYILSIIIFSQFCGTALWFATNGILTQLISVFQLEENELGNLTSAVQLGFIIGTLVFAIFTISDRFSPSKVFLGCAMLGAFLNLATLWEGNILTSLLLIRFLVGFFLAGIYPVGMKIAADYFKKSLGISLSFLVAALVLGTAFPHLLVTFFSETSWKIITICISIIAMLGGLCIGFLVPNGPYREAAQKLKLSAFIHVFKNKKFRHAAVGYFGHMWELYAFWAFIPVFLATYDLQNPETAINSSLWTFLIIAAGSLGCILGGFLSARKGIKKVAYASLCISGVLCLASPLLFELPPFLFLGILMLWGMVVIADSPLFSTLVANNATPTIKGTALTIVNCMGFAITIISIQLLSFLSTAIPIPYLFMILAIGPFLGIYKYFKIEVLGYS
ncbi:nitrate/nitrite transporter [Jejudonia soesokkakensis]|uniref:Nitrate/nitrite transporter n=1 Tax=Jejudonia soesokkakensis TaxID=1323432 RepID=A0ABW2MWH9_9FLAO